jgi:hypothetical protein
MSKKTQAISVIVVIAAATAALARQLHVSSSPFLFATLLLLGVWVFAGLCVILEPKWREAALWALSLSLCFAATELLATLYFQWQAGGTVQERQVAEGYHRGAYYLDDDMLGYGPRPGTTLKIKKLRGEETLYDVTYRIGVNGLRISGEPGAPVSPAAQNVLFFGCSFTFGEGVEDAESLPYAFATKSGGAFIAHNFGFHGYGPHQMLAILEQERERAAVPADSPTPHAVHLALLPGHIDRALGRVGWDVAGPRYVLDAAAEGGIAYSGPFNGVLESILYRVLNKSVTVNRLIRPMLRPYSSGPRDAAESETYARILKRSQDLFEQRYGGDFLVILWPDDLQKAEPFKELFDRHGIRYVMIDQLMPGYVTDPAPYRIAHDGHPTARAFDEIATHLVQRFQGGSAANEASARLGGDRPVLLPDLDRRRVREVVARIRAQQARFPACNAASARRLPSAVFDAVLWGTLSPDRRNGPAAIRDYFVAAFKTLSRSKVTFGDQSITVLRRYGDQYRLLHHHDGERRSKQDDPRTVWFHLRQARRALEDRFCAIPNTRRSSSRIFTCIAILIAVCPFLGVAVLGLPHQFAH